MSTQITMPLIRTPISRNTDNQASRDAEAFINKHKRNPDMARVLLGFYAHPMTTTREMATMAGIDRYVAARRAPDLLTAGLLERANGKDGWRWQVTTKGLAAIERINGYNHPGRP